MTSSRPTPNFRRNCPPEASGPLSGEARRQARFWDAWSQEYRQSVTIRHDDFHYGPLLPGERQLRLLPPLKPGMRALEIGSGTGENSLWLSSQGLECTALDVSIRQIAAGRERAETAGCVLAWMHRCMDELERMDFPAPFDLVHSTNALQFSANPRKVIAAIAGLLAPGGTLILSTQHPLLAGDFIETDDKERLLELSRYFSPPSIRQTAAPRIHAASSSFPVSSWVTWILEQGMSLECLLEPPALPRSELPRAPYRSPAWEAVHPFLRLFPSTLILKARKRPRAHHRTNSFVPFAGN